MTRKGILALEDNEERIESAAAVDEAVDAVPTEAELTAEAPEADAMGEVAQGEARVDEIESQTSDAVLVAEKVDAIGDKVEESVEAEGGLTEGGADALNVAVEGLLNLLGARGPRAKIFPAMEGFKEPTTRIGNTKVALEELRGKTKEIMDAVVAQIKAIMAAVVAFLKSLLQGTAMLKARAEKIKKAADARKDTPAGGMISAKKFGAHLTHGGKILSGNELVAGIGALATDKFINVDYGAVATAANKALAEVAKGVGEAAGASAAAFSAGPVFAAVESHGVKLTKTLHDLPLGGGVYGLYPTFVGQESDMMLVGAVVKVESKQGAVAEEVQAMTPAEAAAVADAVLKNLAKFGKYEQEASSIEASFNTTVSALMEAFKKADAAQAKVDKDIHSIQKMINAIKSVVVVSSVKLRKYDLDTCRAALDYAAASVAAAKAPAAVPKETPATA